MKLKKSREEVLEQIRVNASAMVSSKLYNLNMRVDPNSFSYQLQDMIASSIAEGFRVLLDNQYTDEDFERDMTLND